MTTRRRPGDDIIVFFFLGGGVSFGFLAFGAGFFFWGGGEWGWVFCFSFFCSRPFFSDFFRLSSFPRAFDLLARESIPTLPPPSEVRRGYCVPPDKNLQATLFGYIDKFFDNVSSIPPFFSTFLMETPNKNTSPRRPVDCNLM